MNSSGCGWRFCTVTPWRITSCGSERWAIAHLVLHVDGGDVLVGADLEADGQRVDAVVGRLRRHVDHVRHAVDLRLDRRCDGLLDGGGIGTGEGRGDDDGRRRDLRITGHGQPGQRHAAGQRDQDGDDRREDRSVDEVIDHDFAAGVGA